MELIDRYIYAVTHRLSVDIQADVNDELRSIIDDALDEKGSHSKQAVKEVLTTLGNPALLAAKYSSSPQYIIGPTFYPIFVQSLKLVFGIGLPIVAAIGVIVNIAEPPATIIQAIINVIGFTVGVGIQMLLWTGLVFFVIERSGVSESELHKNSGWTPDMLPATTEKREIPLSDGIADTIWYALVALLPLLAQPLVGAHVNSAFIPVFNPEIWAVGGPILVALGLIGIVKSIFKIRLGKWTKPLAVFNAVYALVFAALLIAAAMITSLINPTLLEALDTQITTSNLEQVSEAATWTLGISIAIFVGTYIYDAVRSLYLAFRTKNTEVIK